MRILMALRLTPLACFGTVGCTVRYDGDALADISQLFAFPLRRSFSELCDFRYDKAALCFGEIGFLQIMKMGRYDILFFVD